MMYHLAVCKRILLPLIGMLLLSGCQPQAVRPDSTASDSDNALDIQQQAYKAYNEGNWAEAEQAYLALTRQIPKDADPWFRLGNIYAHLNRPNEAITAYQEAVVRRPKHAKAWHNMGIVQLRQASNSFSYLESVTETGDPLNERATVLLDTMTQLLESDFSGTETTAAESSRQTPDYEAGQ